MKYTLPAANYSFNASAKTITFSGTIPARISNVMHVANITRGVIYFQPQAGVAFSGSYTSPVLTLAASTSGHSNSDELLIVLDDSATALTDAQLRASAVPVSVSGVATAANQATTNTTLSNIDGDIGAPADAAASSDTGTFSVIALVKRGLQNWTTLQAKIPALVSGAVPTSPNLTRGSGNIDANTLRAVLASDGPTVATLSSIDSKTAALVSGRVPVDGSGVTQPVSAASLPLPSGAATSANQTTTNSSLSSIDTKTPALQSGAVPIGDNSGSLTVDGKAYRVQLDITRPANTTAYAAGAVIGTGSGDDAIHTLASIGPSGGFVLIQSIELVLGIAAVPSGMTSFRLHFYSTKPTTSAANASTFDLASADRGAYIGFIDLPAPVDLGSTCFTQLDYPGKLFKLAAASTSLFCELQTIGGFTPAANSEVYSLRIKTLEAGL